MSQIQDIEVRRIKLKLITINKGFVPSPASLFLASNFSIKKGDLVCDIGTGGGIQAIIAAKLGAKKVYASDINKFDIRVARKNAKLNKVNSKIHIYQADLFESFKDKKFDVILCNPPQIPVPENYKPNITDYGIFSGNDGTEFTIRLINQSVKYLQDGGKLFFQSGQISNPKRIEIALKKKFKVKKIAKIKTPFGFHEMKIMGKLKRMKKQGKASFYYSNGVPFQDRILYECILKKI